MSSLEAKIRSWYPSDLEDARNRRQKGNHPGFAGYRQKGRGEARIAKKCRRRAVRRLGQRACEDGLGG
jgi:hypothetical protein